MFECIVLFLYIIKSFYNVPVDSLLSCLEQSQLPHSSFRITEHFELSIVTLFVSIPEYTFNLFIYEIQIGTIHVSLFNESHSQLVHPIILQRS